MDKHAPSPVPGLLYSCGTIASAMFASIFGDQKALVAMPACLLELFAASSPQVGVTGRKSRLCQAIGCPPVTSPTRICLTPCVRIRAAPAADVPVRLVGIELPVEHREVKEKRFPDHILVVGENARLDAADVAGRYHLQVVRS